MASPKRKLSLWPPTAAAAFAAMAAGAAAAFAQSPGSETVIMNTVDQAVRTGEFDRAAATLRKVAESGNAEAQYRLAALYRIGRGVPQDDGLAFKWMKAAAEQNHARAQFNLGMMYLTGRGAPPDAGAAKIWLQKAASQGYDGAAKLVAEISKRGAADAKAAPADARPIRLAELEASFLRALAAASRNETPEIVDAAWRGQTDVITKLISSGADISARDSDGNTALMRAASAGKS